MGGGLAVLSAHLCVSPSHPKFQIDARSRRCNKGSNLPLSVSGAIATFAIIIREIEKDREDFPREHDRERERERDRRAREGERHHNKRNREGVGEIDYCEIDQERVTERGKERAGE